MNRKVFITALTKGCGMSMSEAEAWLANWSSDQNSLFQNEVQFAHLTLEQPPGERSNKLDLLNSFPHCPSERKAISNLGSLLIQAAADCIPPKNTETPRRMDIKRPRWEMSDPFHSGSRFGVSSL